MLLAPLLLIAAASAAPRAAPPEPDAWCVADQVDPLTGETPARWAHRIAVDRRFYRSTIEGVHVALERTSKGVSMLLTLRVAGERAWDLKGSRMRWVFGPPGSDPVDVPTWSMERVHQGSGEHRWTEYRLGVSLTPELIERFVREPSLGLSLPGGAEPLRAVFHERGARRLQRGFACML